MFFEDLWVLVWLLFIWICLVWLGFFGCFGWNSSAFRNILGLGLVLFCGVVRFSLVFLKLVKAKTYHQNKTSNTVSAFPLLLSLLFCLYVFFRFFLNVGYFSRFSLLFWLFCQVSLAFLGYFFPSDWAPPCRWYSLPRWQALVWQLVSWGFFHHEWQIHKTGYTKYASPKLEFTHCRNSKPWNQHLKTS